MCNDTISASGVFTAKELWRLSKGRHNSHSYFEYCPTNQPASPLSPPSASPTSNSWQNHLSNHLGPSSAASIMSGVSSMHGGLVGHGGLNGVKLEGPGGYYCNSYTPPAANVVDHGLLAQAYSTLLIRECLNKREVVEILVFLTHRTRQNIGL